MPTPVPTMLTMNAVVMPTFAPINQPTYPRIVAPRKEKSLLIWNGRLGPLHGTLRHGCFLGVYCSSSPRCDQEVNQTDKRERPPQARRHQPHLSEWCVEDERKQPE